MGKAKKAAMSVFGYIDQPSRIDAFSEDGKKLPINGKIEFKDVWFRYPAKNEHWVLKGFNLTINPNESVALVGESGAGKSTIVGLLLRYYDIEFGQITIDGVPIQDIDVHTLRSQMGLVQ